MPVFLVSVLLFCLQYFDEILARTLVLAGQHFRVLSLAIFEMSGERAVRIRDVMHGGLLTLTTSGMPRCCLNLLVLVASAVIVASDGDLANDVEQPVAETERAVTALAELFYKRTSFSCKMACKCSDPRLIRTSYLASLATRDDFSMGPHRGKECFFEPSRVCFSHLNRSGSLIVSLRDDAKKVKNFGVNKVHRRMIPMLPNVAQLGCLQKA